MCMNWFSVMPGARNICMGVPSFILCAFSLNGRASLIRFTRARGKLVETVSLIRHFVHETFVCVHRRIQGIRMEFRVYRKDN